MRYALLVGHIEARRARDHALRQSVAVPAAALTVMAEGHCAGCGYRKQYHEGERLACPGLKTKVWQEPAEIERLEWHDVLRRDAQRRQVAQDAARKLYVPAPVPAPLIAARLPWALQEIASYRGQAMGLNTLVQDGGGETRLAYWQEHDGTEGSAIKIEIGTLRGVAVWRRAKGDKNYAADIAYAWRVGEMPAKVGCTALKRAVVDEIDRLREAG